MADIAVPIIAALLVPLGLLGWVLRHRRDGGRSPAMARRRPDPPAAVAAGEATDSERQQLLLETAFLAGEVPAVWYRQQMAAIAAGTAQHRPSL
jgi:hypothetical protein